MPSEVAESDAIIVINHNIRCTSLGVCRRPRTFHWSSRNRAGTWEQGRRKMVRSAGSEEAATWWMLVRVPATRRRHLLFSSRTCRPEPKIKESLRTALNKNYSRYQHHRGRHGCELLIARVSFLFCAKKGQTRMNKKRILTHNHSAWPKVSDTNRIVNRVIACEYDLCLFV